jgi:serine/threonine protein kinase
MEGRRLADRYVLGDLLGRGGMADVHRGHDTRLDREVAIKVFRGVEPVDRQRFDHEMRLLAGLRHPGLVEVYDGGEDGDVGFIVLQLADGPSLADRLRDGPLGPEETDELVRTLAAALAHVHDQGIVHRDVKPSNVLSTGDGRWLLGDFGIARLIDATRLTATGLAIGTPTYLAPEQLQGHPLTAKADVYALGLVALEALTGQPAFAGTRDEAALARLASDPSLDAVSDPVWRARLARMTARDPADRPTAADVVQDLAGSSAATEPLVAAPTQVAPIRPSPVPVRSKGWVWAAAALAVVAVALGVWLAAGSDDPNDVAQASPTTAATSTAPPPTPAPTPPVAATVPPTTAAPTTTAPTVCADLLAQRDEVEAAKRALHDNHDLDPHERHDQDEALKDQKREIDEQLRANGC